MKQVELEKFYESWSNKPTQEIEHDIKSSIRKADVITSKIPYSYLKNIKSVLDFGCGYGTLLKQLQERLTNSIDLAMGVDFSKAAIEVANDRSSNNILKYYKLPYLDVTENIDFLHSIAPDGVDAILLIDLLEHVPDCEKLITTLSEFTKFFVIKLPIESSIFDNYLLPKEYPSSVHSNGHLREFDVNNVYYFIRKLGLTPLHELVYIYHFDDSFPPLTSDASLKQKVIRWFIRIFKMFSSKLLPKKIFLRWVGGGGYVCIASFNKQHILTP